MKKDSLKKNHTNHSISSPILTHYLNCCFDHEKTFYDLVKHDYKNYQTSILMALDLFRLKDEPRYLDMISEASYQSLNHIDRLKDLEPHLFRSENIGFYSCLEAVQNAAKGYKSNVSGEDCFVFADSSFASTFGLLFSNVLNLKESANLNFVLTSFSEDNYLKCRIDITVPAPVPPEFADIFNNPNQRVTGGFPGLSAYTVKQIINRYSGQLLLIENGRKKSVFSIILYQKSDEFNKLL